MLLECTFLISLLTKIEERACVCWGGGARGPGQGQMDISPEVRSSLFCFSFCSSQDENGSIRSLSASCAG